MNRLFISVIAPVILAFSLTSCDQAGGGPTVATAEQKFANMYPRATLHSLEKESAGGGTTTFVVRFKDEGARTVIGRYILHDSETDSWEMGGYLDE